MCILPQLKKNEGKRARKIVVESKGGCSETEKHFIILYSHPSCHPSWTSMQCSTFSANEEKNLSWVTQSKGPLGKNKFKKTAAILGSKSRSWFLPRTWQTELMMWSLILTLCIGGSVAIHFSPCQGVIIPYSPLDQLWTCDEILLLLSTGLLSPSGHEPDTTKANVYEKYHVRLICFDCRDLCEQRVIG